MKTDTQTAPVAVRILAALLAVGGLGYILFPIGALRSDGLLAAHQGQEFGEILQRQMLLVLDPVFGIASISIALLVFRNYTGRVRVIFWSMFVAAIAWAPVALSLVSHYGK